MTQDSKQDQVMNRLEAGTAASLWADAETGRLVILTCLADASVFHKRRRDAGRVHRAEFICEICDPLVISQIRHWNRDLEIPF